MWSIYEVMKLKISPVLQCGIGDNRCFRYYSISIGCTVELQISKLNYLNISEHSKSNSSMCKHEQLHDQGFYNTFFGIQLSEHFSIRIPLSPK